MTHGHEVLRMMEGFSYATTQALEEAIIQKFGIEERFYTCSAENLTAGELVKFLSEHGKFKATDNGFTVDTNSVCKHDEGNEKE